MNARQARHRQLTRGYESIYDRVIEILWRHDPAYITMGDYLSLFSEYSLEARTIVPRLKDAHSGADVAKIAREVFVTCFNENVAGPVTRYLALGEEIWRAWEWFNATTGSELPGPESASLRTMKTISANGIDIFYRQDGTGPDLVLIMGLGAHSGAWAANQPFFAKHFRTLAFDNRGAGRTSAPDEPYAIAGMAADTAALMDALRITSAHVLGVSMGGMIAQELAINYPEKVDRLVIACSRARTGELRKRVSVAQRALWEAGVSRDAISAIQQPWGRTSATLQDGRAPIDLLDLQAQDPYPIAAHAYLRQLDATIAHDTLERLGQIRTETLVLVGAEDLLTPPYESAELAKHIPGAELCILPRGGHAFNAEYPAAFNRAVLEFLRR